MKISSPEYFIAQDIRLITLLFNNTHPTLILPIVAMTTIFKRHINFNEISKTMGIFKFKTKIILIANLYF